MLQTKYDIELTEEILKTTINRLTNQTWKLIPMRENNENWQLQTRTVITEIVGLNEIISFDSNFLQLLSKLEGLLIQEVDFMIYRKTIFEAIALLQGLIKK